MYAINTNKFRYNSRLRTSYITPLADTNGDPVPPPTE
jgi:hypothetical protein